MDSDRENENSNRMRRTPSGLTPALEDYLLAVYLCGRTGAGQTTNMEVADFSGLTTPVISRGAGILSEEGLVIKGGSGRRKYLALTDCGRALAEGLHRRRRTITAYLTFLGLSEAASATEAHLWEHRVSHEIVTAMEVVLQRGKTFAGPPQTASRTQPESRQLRQRFKNPHRYKAQRRRGNRLQ